MTECLIWLIGDSSSEVKRSSWQGYSWKQQGYVDMTDGFVLSGVCVCGGGVKTKTAANFM